MSKKIPLLFSLLMVFALVLSACASGDNTGNETPGAGTTLGTDDGLGNEGTGLGTTGTDDSLGGIQTTPMATVDNLPGTGETPVVTEPVVTEPVATEPAATAPVVGDTTATAIPGQVGQAEFVDRVGEVLGRNIVSSEDTTEEIGQVDSLLVDSQSGQIVYAIVSAGSVLDLENDLVAIPWSQLQLNQNLNNGLDQTGTTATEAVTGTAEATNNDLVELNNNEIVYLGSIDSLRNAPSFAEEDLGQGMVAEELDTELSGYWSNEVASLPQTGADASLMRLADVHNVQLVDANGEDLGDVQDMILDPQAGNITYVVWASGGFLGIGEDLTLIPFEKLSWQTEADGEVSHFILNADQETLQGAPHIANLDELDTTVQGWDQDIQNFWMNVDTSTNQSGSGQSGSNTPTP